MITGSIPSKVNFYATDIKDKEFSEKGRVLFVADVDKEGPNKTGADWQKHRSRGSNETLTVTNLPNTPIKGVRLIDLEHRSEGGRAYKVIFEDFIFDMREDVMMDVIKNCGVKAGGLLGGEFIFATVGSQMKMIRYGSDLHAELLKLVNLKKRSPISNFVIGNVYTNTRNHSLYLGQYLIEGQKQHCFYETYNYGGALPKFSAFTDPFPCHCIHYRSKPTSFREHTLTFPNFDPEVFLTQALEKARRHADEAIKRITDYFKFGGVRPSDNTRILEIENGYNTLWLHQALLDLQANKIKV